MQATATAATHHQQLLSHPHDALHQQHASSQQHLLPHHCLML
jgi:hypothetical protein